jgi:peptidoglycan hydrolase-like protein with peptidoglycan-binding domain
MRGLILMLSVLGIVAGAHSAEAGLSTTPRQMSASVDTTAVTDEANQQTEDQIGLSRAKRRDVQRRLTKLGFETRVNGKFGERTRDAITRWQEERGYPKTGFLNTAQHKALLSENVAAAEADKSDHPDRGRGRARHSRGIGGPIGLIGGVVGGLFRR